MSTTRLTVPPRDLHNHLVTDLALRIVSGDLAPGSVVAVDELTRTTKASRTALREAFRVLAAKGMLEPKPKLGTRVTSSEYWNMLDPDVIGWHAVARLDADLLRHLTEIRETIEPAAARLAAVHAGAEERRVVDEANDRLQASAFEPADAFVESDVLFHVAVLEATKNPFYAQMGPVIAAVLRVRDQLAVEQIGIDRGSLALHTKIASSIVAGKPVPAERAMKQLMVSSSRDTEQLIGVLLGGRRFS